MQSACSRVNYLPRVSRRFRDAGGPGFSSIVLGGGGKASERRSDLPKVTPLPAVCMRRGGREAGKKRKEGQRGSGRGASGRQGADTKMGERKGCLPKPPRSFGVSLPPSGSLRHPTSGEFSSLTVTGSVARGQCHLRLDTNKILGSINKGTVLRVREVMSTLWEPAVQP